MRPRIPAKPIQVGWHWRQLWAASGVEEHWRAKPLASGTRALLYSLFRFTEAVGLWYQKRWAEWLGLFSGSLYVPIEAYELFEGVSWPKVLLLAVNLLIVAYLANVLVRSSRERY